MSFLKIGDRAAGAIKSGGTTRRAAKMVVVDVDHPDIEAYIDWKVKEEQKVAALAAGSKVVKRHLKAILKACVNCEGSGDDCFNVEKNPALKREVKAARRDDVPGRHDQAASSSTRARAITQLEFDTYDTDWESEAYLTVSGQNSNNSVRVTDAFLHAVENDGDWSLTRRLDGKAAKTLKARDLWEKIGYAAWASADPGIQYHTTINDWHTCPASGPIRASNPCSEYMFLDDTACNLASLNLLQFRDPGDQGVRRRRLRARDAAMDADARNLGGDGAVSLEGDRAPLLRLPHARPRLRQYRRAPDVLRHRLRQRRGPGDLRRALTAILTGRAYATSAEIAAKSGAFPGHKANAEAMLRVIRNHKRAADGEAAGYEQLSVAPTPLDHDVARQRRAPPGRASARPRAPHGATRWRSAKRTATATRRSRSSRRPARSAS